MKIGDMIKIAAGYIGGDQLYTTGLVIRIGSRHNGRRVATLLTERGIETLPLDSHYEYEVISESR